MASDRPIRILVVEDDASHREILALVLRDNGYDVLEAGTGEAALGILHGQGAGIDWLFTDIRLPGLVDGWTVANEFRFAHPLRPVVFATATPNETPRPFHDSLFFRKPYRPSEIVGAFRDLNAGIPADLIGASLRPPSPSSKPRP